MRLAYDAALFRGPGGGPQHYVGISTALAESGATITHILPRGSAVDTDSLLGEIVRLPVVGSKVVRQFVYDITRACLVIYWWIIGRRFDVWMSRQSAFGMTLGLARLVADKVVLEVNGPIREEILSNFDSGSAASFADWCFRRQIGGAHLVVAVSHGLAEYVTQRNSSTPVVVVANGSRPFKRSLPDHVSVDRVVPLVFAGALTPWYELETPLRALALLRDEGEPIDLVILGDGVRRAEFVELVAELKLERQVEFRGWVNGEEVSETLLHARVGLLPLQRKHDDVEAVGSPLKLFEYAAAGLRVVGTDIDGVSNSAVRSIVHVYPVGRVDSCAEALRDALAAEVSSMAEDTWSWRSRAGQILEIANRTDSAQR